jgi:hypothetical protein
MKTLFTGLYQEGSKTLILMMGIVKFFLAFKQPKALWAAVSFALFL